MLSETSHLVDWSVIPDVNEKLVACRFRVKQSIWAELLDSEDICITLLRNISSYSSVDMEYHLRIPEILSGQLWEPPICYFPHPLHFLDIWARIVPRSAAIKNACSCSWTVPELSLNCSWTVPELFLNFPRVLLAWYLTEHEILSYFFWVRFSFWFWQLYQWTDCSCSMQILTYFISLCLLVFEYSNPFYQPIYKDSVLKPGALDIDGSGTIHMNRTMAGTE